jgi:hypothetical protein
MIAQDPEVLERLSRAALDLVAEGSGPNALTLAALSAGSGLAPGRLSFLAGPMDAIQNIDAWFDTAMASTVLAQGDDVPTRLFDALMLRFEFMEEHRAGVTALAGLRRGHPQALAMLGFAHLRTARRALYAADVIEPAPLNQIAAAGLARIVGLTEQAWLADSAPDYTRTMATLDRNLREADGWMNRLAPVRGLLSGGRLAPQTVPPSAEA